MYDPAHTPYNEKMIAILTALQFGELDQYRQLMEETSRDDLLLVVAGIGAMALHYMDLAGAGAEGTLRQIGLLYQSAQGA